MLRTVQICRMSICEIRSVSIYYLCCLNLIHVNKRKIRAAGCILPVSHDMDIPKELGLRHRAAMGISQQSDALAIVVSEETGTISVAMRGQFRLRLSAENLEAILTEEL